MIKSRGLPSDVLREWLLAQPPGFQAKIGDWVQILSDPVPHMGPRSALEIIIAILLLLDQELDR